jgi:uncharacterized protein
MNRRSVEQDTSSAGVDTATRYPTDDAWVQEGDRAQLVAGECAGCGKVVFPRLPICPGCHSLDIRPVPLERRGTLYSFTTIHRAPAGFASPYTVGYVDLDRDVRVFAQLRGEPETLRLGATVEVEIDEISRSADGTPVISYVFKVVE